MRSLLLALVGLLPSLARSAAIQMRSNSSMWSIGQFNSLIAFGDSYTDENGLNYFTSSKGKAPPPGTLLPESFSTPGGGRTWPRYVVQYTGQEVDSTFQPQLTLYDYAVAGAVCSNEITPRNYTRFNGVDTPFPDVLSYEVPNFQADLKANRINTSAPYFTPPLTATQAVYTIWIGTNDLGVSTFLQNAQRPGKTIVDFTECVFQVLDEIYAAGGRYFVILNQAPLYLAPLYANSTLMGVDVSHYWPDKPTTGSNLTEVAEQIKEEVTLVNDVYKYQIPYENLVANRYPGANFALFDVNSLMVDIHSNPGAYLNGTVPLNVTGFEYHCGIVNSSDCTDYAPNSKDSFMWYDELHPSEQTDRIIAKTFVEILSGSSPYATYY